MRNFFVIVCLLVATPAFAASSARSLTATIHAHCDGELRTGAAQDVEETRGGICKATTVVYSQVKQTDIWVREGNAGSATSIEALGQITVVCSNHLFGDSTVTEPFRLIDTDGSCMRASVNSWQ